MEQILSEAPFYLERRDITEAEALIASHGVSAPEEARERARNSRIIGNHIAFCRWRQIERYIALTLLEEPFGTVH